MPTTATSQPLTVPNKIPTAIAASRPSSSEPVAKATMATISEVSVNTAPIDRSRPSVMMISVIGSASISRIVDWTSTLEIFGTVRKPGVIRLKTTHSSTSMTATPGIR